MPDTRWILPLLKKLQTYPTQEIPNYPVEWVQVDHAKKEIILIKFKR